MKKKSILALVTLGLLIAVLAGVRPGPVRNLINLSAGAVPAADVPTHVLYDHLFRLVIGLRQRSIEQNALEGTPSALGGYFREEAGLTSEQDRKLLDTAGEFIREVESFDARAAVITDRIRKEHREEPGGDPPPPPPEIGELQQKRDELALSYRERLREALGEKVFAEFDRYVHEMFARNFQTAGANPQN